MQIDGQESEAQHSIRLIMVVVLGLILSARDLIWAFM